jgi:hypothetical protein
MQAMYRYESKFSEQNEPARLSWQIGTHRSAGVFQRKFRSGIGQSEQKTGKIFFKPAMPERKTE